MSFHCKAVHLSEDETAPTSQVPSYSQPHETVAQPHRKKVQTHWLTVGSCLAGEFPSCVGFLRVLSLPPTVQQEVVYLLM